MQSNNQQILLLLKSFLDGVSPRLVVDASDTSAWTKILRLCYIHSVLPMAYDALSTADTFDLMDERLIASFRHAALSNIAIQTNKSRSFDNIYNVLRQNGFAPIVLKGMAIRGMYRKPDCRISGDEDILIKSTEAEYISALLKREGFLDEGLTDEGTVRHFHNKDTGLRIEAHTVLFRDNNPSGNYGVLFKNELPVTEERGYVVLEPTDHLLYLICHTAKHFALSGFGIRQICDIILFTRTYREKIDFDILLKKTRSVSLHVFAASLFNMGEVYFEAINMPEQFKEYVVDAEPLLEDVFDGGIYGQSTSVRRHSIRVTMGAVSGKRKSALLCSIFPAFKDMTRVYPKLERYPILLPLYWAIRLIKLAFSKEIDAKGAMQMGAKRMELLKAYGLVPKTGK